MSDSSLVNTFGVLEKYTGEKYPVGIILGTGLSKLVDKIDITHSIDYADIPEFPIPTVEFHGGKLILGKIAGKNVAALSGRFHLYEGYSVQQITYPVLALKYLGAKHLIVSNASGALNPVYNTADLVAIRSHINFQFRNQPDQGTHFPGVKPIKPYPRKLNEILSSVALQNELTLHRGNYVSVTGPCLETRAEYRMLRMLGADVVGMSTIPEVMLASKLGIQTLGISIITDLGFPDTLKVAKREHSIEAASVAEPNLTKLSSKFIERLEL